MITAGDFKKGITVEWDGGVWTIVDFQHVKPGKGAAFVRTAGRAETDARAGEAAVFHPCSW